MITVELQNRRRQRCQVRVNPEWTHAEMARYLETGTHADDDVRKFCQKLPRGALIGPSPTHQLVSGDGSYSVWAAAPLESVASIATPPATHVAQGKHAHDGAGVGVLYVLEVGSVVLLVEHVARKGARQTHTETSTFVMTTAHLRRHCATPEKLIAHVRRKAATLDAAFPRRFPRTVMSLAHTRVLRNHLDAGAHVVRELPVVVLHHMWNQQPIVSLWMILFLVFAVVLGKWLAGDQRPSDVWSLLAQTH